MALAARMAGIAITKSQDLPPQLVVLLVRLKMAQKHGYPTMAALKREITSLNWPDWVPKLDWSKVTSQIVT